MTAEELQHREDALAGSARAERGRLLAECDWVVVKATETGTPIPTEWQVYRQALRDITSQAGFPRTITWPVRPT